MARSHRGFILALLLLPASIAVGFAQNYPNRPIRMVTPFPAGGGVDIIARALGQKLTMALGQPIIIDNRAGADGMIGSDMVAKAPRDGYTLLLTSTGPLVINPALRTTMPYDTVRDFTPITQVVDNPMCLVIHPSLPVHTVRELIALAKARPGQLNFASGGVGNALHLAGEIFKTLTGVDIVHVPYKGGAPAVTDLVAGQVQIMISSIPMMLPQIRAGRLRALAVASSHRMTLLPEVPTMREAGLAGFNANSWYGLLAPADIPNDVLKRLNAESVRILRNEEMQTFIAQQGSVTVGNSPQEFGAHIKSELVKWRQVVKSAGLVPE